jgi:hypothetical protein
MLAQEKKSRIAVCILLKIQTANFCTHYFGIYQQDLDVVVQAFAIYMPPQCVWGRFSIEIFVLPRRTKPVITLELGDLRFQLLCVSMRRK